MKVLMTTDTIGGVWTYALELARGLERHGVTVAVATMGALPSPEQRREAAGVPGLDLHESGFKLEWMEDPWSDVAAAGDWLLEIEARLRPDVVHLNGYAHGALPWKAPTVVVGHSCVLSWWEAVKGEAAPATWHRYRTQVTHGLRATSLAVAPTRAMLDALDRYYGPLDHTRVIPNGREAAPFLPGRKEPVVLAAGRIWDDAKNVTALAAVAPRLSWPVLVAGEENRPDGRRARPESVRYLGRQSPAALGEWMARAAIYALPARYEPFGLSVLEAALAGCALVLGDIPSLREVWGDAALFVPPEDTDVLERVLRELIEDGERRQTMAERARERALMYTAERMVGGYLAAYGELAAPTPAARERGASSNLLCSSSAFAKANRLAPLSRAAGEGSGVGARTTCAS